MSSPHQISAPPVTANTTSSDKQPPSPTAPPYSPITPEMAKALPLQAQTSSQPPPSTSDTQTFEPIHYVPPTSLSAPSVPPQPHQKQPLQHGPPPTPPNPTPPHRNLQPPPIPNQQPQQPSPQPLTQLHPPVSQPQNPPAAPPPQQPPPQPLDLASNPDAIALNAAISLLQLQRQRAVKDLQTLKSQKEMALSDPIGFSQALAWGNIKKREIPGVLGPTFADDESSDSDCGNHPNNTKDEEDIAMNDYSPSSTCFPNNPPPSTTFPRDPSTNPSTTATTPQKKPFGTIPIPQNIFRTPPINWSQYHIVGPALDRLHSQQIKNPTEGRPRTDEDVEKARAEHLERQRQLERFKGKGRVGETVLAAPYDVFRDELVERERVGSGSNGAGSGGGIRIAGGGGQSEPAPRKSGRASAGKKKGRGK